MIRISDGTRPMNDSRRPDSGPLERQTDSLGEQPSPRAVCYRMEPVRQMPSHGSCTESCGGPGEHSPNHMPPCLLSDQQHTVMDFGSVHRVALMVTPQIKGRTLDQAWEAMSTLRVILNQQPVPMTLSMQTVFVRSPDDIDPIRNLMSAYHGRQMPPTSFIVQPPCGGQSLAIEAWALGGEGITVERPAKDAMVVEYDGLRWIHIAGITPHAMYTDAYGQSGDVFEQLRRRLQQCNSGFRDVPRIWLYQGGITELQSEKGDEPIERYRELNRARTDFFDDQHSKSEMNVTDDGHLVYPASTGIGTAGNGLTLSCLGLQTSRPDVRLQALENPGQTSAYDYARRFSIKSPKFSRAMALVIGDDVTTWISGTASILNSESVHVGDVEKQTHQTIDNIRRLIDEENLRRHGLPGAGADLSDLAKVRVYLKRPEDYEAVRKICRARFGDLPTIYAQADVCRSDLLVEIEGVAFSRIEK